MEPITIIMIPGIVGGVVAALLVARWNRRAGGTGVADSSGPAPPSTDVINMARIRVGGIGGLGFVAMAVVVAFAVPRIGQSLASGLILGAGLAVALVAWRRRRGPMPSSGRRPGANTMLSIDSPAEPTGEDRGGGSRLHGSGLVGVHLPPAVRR